MAIIEGVQGIEVGIRVKEPAHEYQDSEAELEDQTANESRSTQQVTRYIESLTDEEFQITLSVKGHHHPHLMFYVYIDGVRAFHKPVSAQYLQEKGIWYYIVLGKRVGDFARGLGGYQAFKFSSIETSSEDEHKTRAQDDANMLKGIGVIRVEVHRAKQVLHRHRPLTLGGHSDFESNTPGVVHEKAMKGEAKSHSVTLGNINSSSKGIADEKFEVQGDRKSPIAVFLFKYRSKASLEKLLVIRPAEPDLLQGLGNYERVKAERYIDELRNKNSQGSGDRKGVKRERTEVDLTGEPRKKKRPNDQIEMIDLTGD